jgi:hypothetical protein
VTSCFPVMDDEEEEPAEVGTAASAEGGAIGLTEPDTDA